MTYFPKGLYTRWYFPVNRRQIRLKSSLLNHMSIDTQIMLELKDHLRILLLLFKTAKKCNLSYTTIPLLVVQHWGRYSQLWKYKRRRYQQNLFYLLDHRFETLSWLVLKEPPGQLKPYPKRIGGSYELVTILWQ